VIRKWHAVIFFEVKGKNAKFLFVIDQMNVLRKKKREKFDSHDLKTVGMFLSI